MACLINKRGVYYTVHIHFERFLYSSLIVARPAEERKKTKRIRFITKISLQNMGKFEIYKDIAGQYRWRLKAGNGEIVASSEGYIYKSSALSSAQNVKGWASGATIVDLA